MSDIAVTLSEHLPRQILACGRRLWEEAADLGRGAGWPGDLARAHRRPGRRGQADQAGVEDAVSRIVARRLAHGRQDDRELGDAAPAARRQVRHAGMVRPERGRGPEFRQGVRASRLEQARPQTLEPGAGHILVSNLDPKRRPALVATAQSPSLRRRGAGLQLCRPGGHLSAGPGQGRAGEHALG